MRPHCWWLRVVVFAGLAGFVVCRLGFPGRAFDRDLWLDTSRLADGVRADMADRLLARGTLDEMTRDEVIDLLGPPTWQAADRMGYELGPSRSSFAVDGEWLTAFFGPGGRVVRCKVWQD